MTKDQIDQINDLRLQGFGPSRIAQVTGLSLGAVASHIRRHPAPPGTAICQECGVFITPTTSRRRRKFCCDKCRTTWWNKHRTEGKRKLITITCAHCGKEFQCYESDHRKYCSRDCYHSARRTAGTDR